MNLINDLGTDLALAFLVEKRYRQRIDSEDALALIGRVRRLLESTTERRYDPSQDDDRTRTASTH